ncbi:MAG TPA: hypothetical protein VLA26_05685 [Gammaproteobacteria bacterium]|nr:hypothetical protein [Gammaproteobacteria bacterium]
MVRQVLAGWRLWLWLVLLPAGAVAEAPGVGPWAETRVEALTPAARDAGHTLQVRGEPVATDAWFNQPVRLVLWIGSDSPYAFLETESIEQPGVETIELPAMRQSREVAGATLTEYRVGWVFYPRVTGPVELELPPLRFRRDGLVTHRIELPRIRLQVRPLPRFVPPTLPIGPLVLEVEAPQGMLLRRGKLEFLRLRILGEAPPGQSLSGLLRQLRSDARVTFYPPRELTAGAGGWRDGRHETVYEIPFASQATGSTPLPVLHLQYFDPGTGKLVTRHQALGRYLSLPRWLLWAGLLLLALGVGLLLRALYRGLARRLRTRRGYRAALRVLRRAQTPAELKDALMEIAAAEAWPRNLTLTAWLRHWAGRYPRLGWITDDILRLQAWCYGGREAPLEEIRQSLVRLCQRRMSLLRFSLSR